MGRRRWRHGNGDPSVARKSWVCLFIVGMLVVVVVVVEVVFVVVVDVVVANVDG